MPGGQTCASCKDEAETDCLSVIEHTDNRSVKELALDKRNERGQATRENIIAAAKRLFTERGYAETSTDLVLQTSGISRGALYHHFVNKEALFTAVLEAVETDVTMQVVAAAQKENNPLGALRTGCAAWLSLARDPAVRQIALIDAPSVLGWQAWREIDNKYALGLLKSALHAAAVAGSIRENQVEIYAHMLIAMLGEIALLIARSDDAEGSLRSGQEAVEQLISRLVGAAPSAPA